MKSAWALMSALLLTVVLALTACGSDEHDPGTQPCGSTQWPQPGERYDWREE